MGTITKQLIYCWTVVAVVGCFACNRTRSPTVSAFDGGETRIHVAHSNPPMDVDVDVVVSQLTDTGAVHSGRMDRVDVHVTTVSSQDAGPSTQGNQRSIEQVVALNSRTLVALGSARLYRWNRNNQWTTVQVTGAEPRSLSVWENTLYLLAKGRDDIADRAVIMNSRDGEQFTVVTAPSLGAASDPTSLSVMDNNEFYIGGRSPALVRVQSRTVTVLNVTEPAVEQLLTLPNETLFAVHSPTKISITRWGEVSVLDTPEFNRVLLGTDGALFVQERNGSIARGRPGRELVPFTVAPPFVPSATLVLPPTRAVIASDQGIAVWNETAWNVVSGARITQPVAIVSAETDYVYIVSRSGDVTRLNVPRAQVEETR